jgi:NAD(P)H-nitrite reductase large subunit
MADMENLVICRCEEVTYGELISTVNKYNCTARELKLRTRAGMGFCGGRTCRCLIDRIIENIIPNTEQGEISLKYQPPIRPIAFGTVGERKCQE